VLKITQHEKPIPKRWWQQLFPKLFARNGHRSAESQPKRIPEIEIPVEVEQS